MENEVLKQQPGA